MVNFSVLFVSTKSNSCCMFELFGQLFICELSSGVFFYSLLLVLYKRKGSISRVFITSKFQFDYGTLFQLAFPKPTFPNPSWKANVQKYTLPVKLNSIRKRSFTIALLDPELCCIRLLIYSCSNLSEMSDFST